MAQNFDSLQNPAVEEMFLQGRVGVIPTDTVYGLACRAGDEKAVRALYQLKNREQKPGTIVAADTKQFEELGIKHSYLTPIAHYWPSSVSVLLPVDKDKLIYLHQGLQTLAVRVPKYSQLRWLLQATGPLLTTSANPPDETPAGTVTQAESYFGEKVDFYVNGGDLSGRPPSTLIRVVDDAVVVLRKGAVNINEKGEIVS